MPFESKLVSVDSGDGMNFVLTHELVYISSKVIRGGRFTVPVGSPTDGASVPKFLWNLFPPFGSYWEPAILHDWLYRSTDIPKKTCDSLFLEAMLDHNVPRLKAETIYLAVKWFGGAAFKEDRALLAQNRR